MTLGQIIKKYRKNNNLSMVAFSERSGISKAYISLLEKNKNPKTGKPITPSIQCIKQAADGMNMDFNILFSMIDSDVVSHKPSNTDKKIRLKGVRIPVLSCVRAGVPTDAAEEVIGWEDISPDLAASGDYFAFQIKDDSMEHKFSKGDVVIVREQPDVESGEIAVVSVSGGEAAVKKFVKYNNGSIALASLNPAYLPVLFTPEQIDALPVCVIGKVVELRAKF